MIDWHHPRIYARLRCFGLVFFALGIASRQLESPVIAVSPGHLGVASLPIEVELGISSQEDSQRLDTPMHKINRVNQWMLVPILVGSSGVMKRLSDG